MRDGTRRIIEQAGWLRGRPDHVRHDMAAQLWAVRQQAGREAARDLFDIFATPPGADPDPAYSYSSARLDESLWAHTVGAVNTAAASAPMPTVDEMMETARAFRETCLVHERRAAEIWAGMSCPVCGWRPGRCVGGDVYVCEHIMDAIRATVPDAEPGRPIDRFMGITLHVINPTPPATTRSPDG